MRDILILGWIFGTLPLMFVRPFYGLICFTILAYNRTQDLSWGIAGTLPLSEVVALAMIAGYFLNHRGPKFISDRRHWLMILLALWIGLSVFFAFVPALGYRKFSEFLKIILVAIMTPSLVNSRERLRVMMWAVALSFGFYGVKNALLHETILRGPGGLLADNNDFSSAMVMNLPFLMYLGHTEEKRLYRIGFYLAVPLTALTIAFTESRGGFLAMCVVFMALTAKSKRWYLAVMAAPVVAAVFFAVVPQKYIERLKTIKEHKDASSQGRLKAWATATRMTEAHPWFGVGYRNFVYAYPRYAENSLERGRVAHNSYFQLMAESGIPALFYFLFMIFLNWKNARWIQKEARFLNAKSWIRNYAAVIEVTTYGYVVAATFLNRAHFDLLYHVVGITVAVDRLARAEFAAIREERERRTETQEVETTVAVDRPSAEPVFST
ncbi:MAG: putative O-glycosylation ligase, exosortase A system-associated [Planctomycetes bacterium]|nr:putative O-glycosylation ligase, exosortase A system-associated [Planctomycetota bacterium]MBI3845880.1 putative O-glycosylation ligase, exosortase A system-associated [Planctomycetota bacterium]